jgi:hypothetical protein
MNTISVVFKWWKRSVTQRLNKVCKKKVYQTSFDRPESTTALQNRWQKNQLFFFYVYLYSFEFLKSVRFGSVRHCFSRSGSSSVRFGFIFQESVRFGSVRVHFQKTGSSSVRIDSNRTEPFSFGSDRFVFGLWSLRWTTKENTYDNMKRRREERKEKSNTYIWQERKKQVTTREEKKNICIMEKTM